MYVEKPMAFASCVWKDVRAVWHDSCVLCHENAQYDASEGRGTKGSQRLVRPHRRISSIRTRRRPHTPLSIGLQ